MKKFEVIEYFTFSKVYEIEADSLQKALDKVVIGYCKPVTVTDDELAETTVKHVKKGKSNE